MDYSKLMPQFGNMHTKDWFKEASQHLQKIQEEAQLEEDELWQNKRKVYLEELQEEMEWLKEHENDRDGGFVKLLLEKFPPKHREEEEWRKLVPEEDEEDQEPRGGWKKFMMKMVTVYHPDR